MADATDESHGLVLLREWIAHDRQPPMGRTLGIRLVEAERGRAVFERAPDRSVYNPLRGVHGGYAATMLDSACGVAVASTLAEGMGHTTLELKVSYLRGLTRRSVTVRAEGRLISLGRRRFFRGEPDRRRRPAVRDGDLDVAGVRGGERATRHVPSVSEAPGVATGDPPPVDGSGSATDRRGSIAQRRRVFTGRLFTVSDVAKLARRPGR